MNDQDVNLERVSEEIRTQAQGDLNAIVLIDAQYEVPVQRLVRVMDRVRAPGLENVQMLDPASRERLMGE